MCRLRTSSLPQPSRTARFCFTAPAVSLRASVAQRGNPVNKSARSAFLLSFRRKRYICATQHYQLDCFVTLAMTSVLESPKGQVSRTYLLSMLYYLCSNKKRADGAFFIQPRLMPRWSARLPNQQESGHMLLLL